MENSPVSSPPPAAEEPEPNTGVPRLDESSVDPYSAPGQSEFDNIMGNDTNDTPDASGLSEHDDSRDTVMMKSPAAQRVFTSSPGPPRASEPQAQPLPSSNDLFLQQMMTNVSDNYTCKTHNMLSGMLGGIQDKLQE